uniref:t-SNARE coiled-coil homology domain-containing protein n=1 Tax=Prymnesium polylepis TaxID=72548 RepID=A0A7S4M8R2_9EUKA
MHRGGRPLDDDDDFYGKGTAETQKLLVKEQDDTIRGLAASVQRVQGMALMVNESLAEQNRLLDDIDEDVDRTDSKLKSLHGKLARLANDGDRGKHCVICLLLGVLGFLVFLVLGS